MSWFGYVMPPVSLMEQAESAAENGTPEHEPAMGPPPDHPERLADGQPLTPAERELWERLRGIDW